MPQPDSQPNPSAPGDQPGFRFANTTAMALSLFLLAVYLATSALRFQSLDEVAVFAVGRSLAARGTLDVDGLFWAYLFMGEGAVVAPGLDGHFYSLKDLAPSVLITPLIWAAYRLGLSPMRAAFLLPPLVTAVTAGLLYRLSRRMGFGQVASLLMALTFGLASMAWPYAETLFTQPFVALWLTITTYGVLRAMQRGKWWPALLAGMAAGLMGLSAVVMWLVALLYLIYLVPWESLGRPGGRQALRRALPALAACAGSVGLFAFAQAAYNAVRFGSPLDTGHAHTSGLAFGGTTFATGSAGLLVSFPRGVVWYAPFVLLVPIGAALAWRNHRRLVILVVVISALLVGLYGAWYMWWGGLAWGPRFLVSLMPLWALLCAPLFERLLRPAPAWARLGAAAVLAASLVVQAAASLLNSAVVEADIHSQFVLASEGGTWAEHRAAMLNPAWLPLVRLAHLALADEWNVLAMARDRPDALLLAAQVGLVALGGIWLSLCALGRWRLAVRAAGIATQAALSAGMAAFMLVRYPHAPDGYLPTETPDSPGMAHIIANLSKRAAPGDGLVLVLPHSYLGWFDRYDGALPEANFPIANPLHPESVEMLERISARHERVWLVTRGVVGGSHENGVELWLAERAFMGDSVAADDGMRLVAYTFAPGLPPPQPIGAEFGGEGLGTLALQSYRAALTWHPESAWLNVELLWRASQTPPIDYTVTAQLFDVLGERVGQHDSWPAAGYAPTTTWEPGVPVIDRHSLVVAPGLPPGDYVLRVALYDWQTGEPLPLRDGSGDTAYLPITIPAGD